MFGRKKKTEDKAKKAEQIEAARLVALNPKTKITVMPEKFWLPEEPIRKFWTTRKVWLLVILAMALLIGAVYVLLSSSAPQANQNISTETSNILETVEPETLPNENESNSANNNIEDETNVGDIVDVVEPTEPDADSDTVPADAAPLPPTIAPRGIDQDGDGLTNIEERLFGTDDQLTDSDTDTFIDTVELLNGYNPAGTGLLNETDLFSEYINENGGYRLLYPTIWQPAPSGRNGVQFPTGTGETILVILQNNPNKLALLEWYQQVTGLQASEIKTKTIGNVVGVLSDDERTFYFALPSRPDVIFVVNHSIGSKRTVDFGTTVEFMIRSFSTI